MKKTFSKSAILNTEVNFKNRVFNSENKDFNTLLKNKQYISFSNCVFKSKVHLKNFVTNRVSFTNCEFYNELYLEEIKAKTIILGGCEFDKRVILLNNSINTLSIDECESKGGIFINGEYNELLVNSTKADLINILDVNSSSNLKNSSIEFFGKSEVKKLNFECESVFSKIIFKQTGTYDSISFEGEYNNQILFEGKINCENLFFSSSLINNRIDIKKGFFKYLSFSRSSFNGLIWIHDLENSEKNGKNIEINRLTLHSNLFREDVSIGNVKIKDLNLSNNSFEKLFTFNTYNENVSALEEIWLSFDGVNQGSVLIQGIKCYLSLEGINFGSVIFRNITFSELLINDYQNKGSISFFNTLPEGWFTIQDSTTGNMEFLNSNVNLFDEIVIANSNIESIHFNHYLKNIKSYSSNSKVGYGIKDKSKNRNNLRSVYNQLKQVARKRGNVDELTKYKALEYKQLLLDKKLNLDKLLLILNWISNDNNRSWFRGVLFTLTTGLIFFSAYLYTLEVKIDFKEKLFWTDYILFISSFPKFSIEKYSQYNSIWSVSLVIWLSRIFISYGIYQTIAAFRKFGKN